jgi:hypothetical protein
MQLSKPSGNFTEKLNTLAACGFTRRRIKVVQSRHHLKGAAAILGLLFFIISCPGVAPSLLQAYRKGSCPIQSPQTSTVLIMKAMKLPSKASRPNSPLARLR